MARCSSRRSQRGCAFVYLCRRHNFSHFYAQSGATSASDGHLAPICIEKLEGHGRKFLLSVILSVVHASAGTGTSTQGKVAQKVRRRRQLRPRRFLTLVAHLVCGKSQCTNNIHKIRCRPMDPSTFSGGCSPLLKSQVHDLTSMDAMVRSLSRERMLRRRAASHVVDLGAKKCHIQERLRRTAAYFDRASICNQRCFSSFECTRLTHAEFVRLVARILNASTLSAADAKNLIDLFDPNRVGHIDGGQFVRWFTLCGADEREHQKQRSQAENYAKVQIDKTLATKKTERHGSRKRQEPARISEPTRKMGHRISSTIAPSQRTVVKDEIPCFWSFTRDLRSHTPKLEDVPHLYPDLLSKNSRDISISYR